MASQLVGARVEVAGYDSLGLVGSSLVACEPGVCCNSGLWAPLIECQSGPDILLIPAEGVESDGRFQCTGPVGSDPATVCPAPACPSWSAASGVLSGQVTGPDGEPVYVLQIDDVTGI